MNFKTESLLAVITIGSTFAWSDVAIKIAVGVATYFISRILYRLFSSRINRLINRFIKM